MMRNFVMPAIFLAGAALSTTPAQAQSGGRAAVEGRVDRLEGEMRAVQRKVFPGGSGQYVQPDNQPNDPQSILPGSPTSPVADLTTRVDSLETQLRGMTAQIETNEHRAAIARCADQGAGDECRCGTGIGTGRREPDRAATALQGASR